jgi:hypothetical protein
VSPPKDGPRNWDKELADIDKLIASGAGSAPAPVPAKGRGSAPAAPAGGGAALAPGGRRALLATWLWFLLAVLLGAGLTQWPYAKDCGLPFYGYLGSVGAFGLASLWSTVWSWRTRSAAVHFLSIGLLFWGTFLAGREILPRIGYAKHSAPWQCPVPRTSHLEPRTSNLQPPS